VEILFVEDDRNDVELTLRVVARHNLANRIEVACDGAAALAFLFDDNGATAPRRATASLSSRSSCSM
jgi:hypothetical protein